ncbi:MAG: hypothetical protein HY063_11605 [Bacteroidetes bacterium]|nr:hypothetical protein [Bacteroidota bacterium]
MKVFLSICFLAIFYISFYSCSKDIATVSQSHTTKIDTIFPKSYFPTYPGSWWTYSNGATMKTDKYVDLRYNKNDYRTTPEYEEYVLPRLLAKSIFYDTVYVKGYSLSTCGGTCGSYFVPILCDPNGDCGEGHWDYFSGHQWSLAIWKTDTSVVINPTIYSHTLITLQYDAGYFGIGMNNAEQYWMTREYYTKDIGLIKREERNTPFDTVITTKFTLVSYHINK